MKFKIDVGSQNGKFLYPQGFLYWVESACLGLETETGVNCASQPCDPAPRCWVPKSTPTRAGDKAWERESDRGGSLAGECAGDVLEAGPFLKLSAANHGECDQKSSSEAASS